MPSPFRLRPLEPPTPSDELSDETSFVAANPITPLRWPECALGMMLFVTWILLFAGGILVDTAPYRYAISPSGAEALAGERQAAAAPPVESVPATSTNLIVAWLVVGSCFAPLNLAWLCAAASGLGAFGNRANLGDDRTSRSTDTSNPYASAALRGFFVYLFMMSGLLVFDDAPFSSPGPGQYIRLAGFLSLFGFVVSYQPKFFGALIVAAFHRIQVRDGETVPESMVQSDADTVRASVDVDRGTVDVAVAKHSAHARVPGDAAVDRAALL